MKTDYRIKNFRAFGEDGVELKIAPLTILTGCNSSGKSSIAKSLLLLDTFLSKVKLANEKKTNFELDKYTLDFNDYPLNLLGRFDKVLNSNSDTGEIEYRYIADNGLEVEMIFIKKDEDVLNRGYLKRLTILKDEEIVYTTQEGSCELNLLPLFETYLNIGYQCNYITKSGISMSAKQWAIDNNSLFRVPLLEKIGCFNHEEFLDKLNVLLSEVYEKVPGLSRVIMIFSEIFSESGEETFSDFFKFIEKKWLSNISSDKEMDSGLDIEMDFIFEGSNHIPMVWPYHETSLMRQKKEWLKRLYEIAIGKESFNECQSEFFPFLLNTLVYVGIELGLKNSESFFKIKEKFISGLNITAIQYILYEKFISFCRMELKKALMPSWTGMLSYVGSTRIGVKRLYTLDSKSDFSSLLDRYFNARRDFVELKTYDDDIVYKPDAFMNKWIYEFGIGDSVTLDMDSEGLGVVIRLHKGKRETLLADEGYGITQLFSILLEIETAIQIAHKLCSQGRHSQKYDIHDYTKVVCRERFIEQTMIIEEPEIHLHPDFQSKLAEMFVEAMNRYNIHFIIETHSEYMIRRLQVLVCRGNIKKEKEDIVIHNVHDVSVVYFDKDGNSYNMGLKETGVFSRKFGKGFLDVADDAAIQLFELNNN